MGYGWFVEYTISGEIAQSAKLSLSSGEWVWASKGSLVSYSEGVEWRLRVPGGIGGAVRRSVSGEGVSLTQVTSSEEGGHAVLAANSPGHITEWDLTSGGVVTTRGSFLAAWGPDVDITVTVAKRAGAAFFGGAGLFLQRVSGNGKCLLHGSGDFIERVLEPGELLTVSSGNLAAFADTIDYSIKGVGGFRKLFFGGEGLFMTQLAGPGRVLLQSLKSTYSGRGNA